MVSLKDLKKVDDNVSLDRLHEEADSLSEGDPFRFCEILDRLILTNLRRIKMEEERQEVPKKPWSNSASRVSRKVPLTSSLNASTNGCKKRGSNAEKQNMNKNKKLKLASEEELKTRGACLDLPKELMAFVRKKQGTEPVMVIRKLVYKTDLSITHGRFSMPMKQLAVSAEFDRRFLTKEEWLKVTRGEGVGVSFVETEFFEETKMELKEWEMSNNKYCNLMTGWAEVLRKYENKNKYRGLKEGDIVQVWAFRCNEEKELWLALTVVDKAES